jgi:hypothetical protein
VVTQSCAGSIVLDNECPVMFDVAEEIEIRFSGGEGSLTVTGTGLRVGPTRDAEYVDEFSGISRPIPGPV